MEGVKRESAALGARRQALRKLFSPHTIIHNLNPFRDSLRSSHLSLALASSLVTWESTLPNFKRKDYFEQVCRPGKPVSLTMTDGLGINLRTLLLRSKGESGSGERQVIVEDGVCTVFAKNEKTWKEIEEEESADRAKKMDARMVSMLQMISEMGDEMGTKMDAMGERLKNVDGGGGGGGGVGEGGGEVRESGGGLGKRGDDDDNDDDGPRKSLGELMNQKKKKDSKRKKLLKFMRGKI